MRWPWRRPSPRRSGALITADYALDQGRELLVHAAGLEGQAGAGSRRLRDEGAGVVAGPADIGRLLQETRVVAVSERPARMLAGELEQELDHRGGCAVAVRHGKVFQRGEHG